VAVIARLQRQLTSRRFGSITEECGPQGLFDYLPTDPDERVTQERIRLIIAAQYLWAGRTAKETSDVPSGARLFID